MQTGERVADRFVIRDLADRGASGAVYRATDTTTNADVALKIIDSETLEEHFLREARVLEGLRHPTIVSYVAHGTTGDGRVYLALEWLDGETLSRRLRVGPLSLLESLAITRAVADALAHAHALGVVHRDVKPSNIFLTAPEKHDAGVKLIDFGIAQLRQATRITRTGTTMGTPAYMAPEQARAGKIDGRADIFSLGCVLYRCLTGVAPFQAENVTATLAKVLFEEPMPMRSRRREIPFELDALVLRMLAKDPAERVPSAKALIEELDRAPTELRLTSVPPADASSPSLTLSERRFVSVVLARSYGDQIDVPRDDPTIVTDSSERMLSSRRTPASADGQIVRLVDGTLAATFGGADHVEQAAHCALEMQKQLERGRIVMTSGLAVVEERLPLGEVIERAAQMLDRAPGKLSGIRVDAISARLLEARFDVMRDGDDAVLLGERRARAQPRTLMGKPTPHVGRERELAALVGLVDECIAESSPRCAIVTGVAGLGKSRLASEVIERARESHASLVTWFARGDNMSAGSSFALTADLVRDAVQAGRDEPARLVGALLEGVRGQRDDLASDPRSYGDRVVTACEDLVRSVAARSPLLVVIDDLQWGDLATVRLIGVVMRNLQNTPLCVLAVARPDVEERFPNLWGDRAPLAIALSDLSPRAARKLVTSVLGDVDEALVAKVVERAAGNAFHLEELVRAVAEGRDAALPETVVAMVSTRMESLDAESRRFLRAASVFGETFWEQGVLALLGETSDAEWTEHAERLRQLVRQELVVPSATSQFAGDAEYRFRHAIVRDAAYAALTDSDRAVGHRIAAEWLSAAGSNDARTLAEHFDRGGVPERAAYHYLRAAQQSLLAGDVASVLDLCGRARACASTSTAELARLEAEAYFWQTDFARAEAAAATCLAMRTVEDGVWWSCAALAVVACLRREGWERALPIYERMLSSSQGPPDSQASSPRLVASARVAVHLCAAGRFAEADKLMQSVHADLARGEVTGDVVLGAVRAAEAMRALCAGDIARYHVTMGEAAMLYERGGDLRNACNAECNLGFCRAELGVWDDAEKVLRASLARARRLGLISVEYNALHNLGYVLFRLGRIEEARAMESDCARVFEEKGDGRTAGGSRLYLAMMALETGALDVARGEAEHALRLLADTPPLRPYALAVLVFVHLARGNAQQAKVVALEASSLADALGAMEQGEAYVRLAVAEAMRAAGDVEGAKRAVIAARARLVERGAIMSEPIRESFFRRVPENARTFALADELGL
jgi:serine/threonine protein kinase/tetratricopeptide (TPR) repeat protein